MVAKINESYWNVNMIIYSLRLIKIKNCECGTVVWFLENQKKLLLGLNGYFFPSKVEE